MPKDIILEESPQAKLTKTRGWQESHIHVCITSLALQKLENYLDNYIRTYGKLSAQMNPPIVFVSYILNAAEKEKRHITLTASDLGQDYSAI
jgi:hypothetical protein